MPKHLQPDSVKIHAINGSHCLTPKLQRQYILKFGHIRSPFKSYKKDHCGLLPPIDLSQCVISSRTSLLLVYGKVSIDGCYNWFADSVKTQRTIRVDKMIAEQCHLSALRFIIKISNLLRLYLYIVNTICNNIYLHFHVLIIMTLSWRAGASLIDDNWYLWTNYAEA